MARRGGLIPDVIDGRGVPQSREAGTSKTRGQSPSPDAPQPDGSHFGVHVERHDVNPASGGCPSPNVRRAASQRAITAGWWMVRSIVTA